MSFSRFLAECLRTNSNPTGVRNRFSEKGSCVKIKWKRILTTLFASLLVTSCLPKSNFQTVLSANLPTPIPVVEFGTEIKPIGFEAKTGYITDDFSPACQATEYEIGGLYKARSYPTIDLKLDDNVTIDESGNIKGMEKYATINQTFQKLEVGEQLYFTENPYRIHICRLEDYYNVVLEINILVSEKTPQPNTIH